MPAFLIKLFLNGIVIVPMLTLFTNASYTERLGTTVALSAMAYLVGDQIILRYWGNMAATVVDIGLAFVFLWLTGIYLDWNAGTTSLIWTSLALGVIEYFFHWFLQGRFGRTV